MPKKEAAVVFYNKKVENLSFEALLKKAKLNLKSIKINEKEKSDSKESIKKNEEIKNMALMEIPKKSKLDEILNINQCTLLKPPVVSVAIPLPPSSSLVSIDKLFSSRGCEDNATIVERNNNEILKKPMGMNQVQMTCFHYHDNNHNEEEMLSLQVLSARSSTPFTQATSLTATSGDLENVSERVSPVKDDMGNACKQGLKEIRQSVKPRKNPVMASKSVPSLSVTNECEETLSKTKSSTYVQGDSIIHYSRANLHMIRNEMSNTRSKQDISPYVHSNILNCDVIELEARLRRLNIWKSPSDADINNNNVNISNSIGTNNSTLKSRCNDMMPAFVKRKFMDESIIRSQPPQPVDFKDPAIITNQRRIGSGRIIHNKWSGTFSKNLSGDNDVTDLNDKSGKNRVVDVGKSNYVKRVMTGFLVVSNPKDRETEESYDQHRKNQQNEEPEWFSCGPTSRLDTIELCGFDEDDEQHLSGESNSSKGSSTIENGTGECDINNDESKENRIQNANKMELSGRSKWSDSNKCRKFGSKIDSNNNFHDCRPEKSDHNPKKSIPFQYDQFSGNTKLRCQNNNYNNINEIKSTGGYLYQHYNKSSRFLPFFGGNAPKNNASDNLDKNGSSASLNEFFKQAINPQRKSDSTHPPQQHNIGNTNKRLPSDINISEIPSVDELEAKWRQTSSTFGRIIKSNENYANDANNNTISRESENFKKLIGQLNNYGTMNTSIPQMSSILKADQQQQHNKSDNNLFSNSKNNNENLSNIIFKHHLQQKQQQSSGISQPNSLQQQYSKQNVFLQQQQAALI
ncbi:hypothetical protein DOY81_009351, partial [Sarcophaga bullata]